MDTDCDNSGSHEASGLIGPPSKTDSESTETKERKKKIGWVTRLFILGIVALAGWYWFNPPLSQEEKALVGQWRHSQEFPDGKSYEQVVTYNANRDWFLESVTHIPAANGNPAEDRQGASFGHWKFKDGKLTLDPDRAATERTFLIVRQLVNGLMARPLVDKAQSEGRIRFLSDNEIQIEWYDPVSKNYVKDANNRWTRVE